METEFIVKKRICNSTDGFQFLTSGYPNRSKDKKTFNSMDGLWAKDLLPDLKDNETDHKDPDGKLDSRQGIQVNVHVSSEPKDDYELMFVFGFLGRSRLITPFAPKNVRKGKDSTIADISHGAMYIDTWCCKDYFPEIPEGTTFPIYIKVTRIEE